MSSHSLLCSRVFALGLLFVGCAEEASAVEGLTFLTAKSTLSFTRGSDGEVFAEFEISFVSPYDKVLCVREGMLPGSDDFDTWLIKFRNPAGRVLAPEPETSSSAVPDVADFAMRFLVFRRKTRVHLGVRIGKSDYVFNTPGQYSAEFVIPLYDCAKLADVANYHDGPPGWSLGNLVTQTSAVLK